jgi:hypothetical protein
MMKQRHAYQHVLLTQELCVYQEFFFMSPGQSGQQHSSQVAMQGLVPISAQGLQQHQVVEGYCHPSLHLLFTGPCTTPYDPPRTWSSDLTLSLLLLCCAPSCSDVPQYWTAGDEDGSALASGPDPGWELRLDLGLPRMAARAEEIDWSGELRREESLI